MKTLAQIFEEYSELPEFLGMELRSVNQEGRFGDSMLQVAIFRKDPEEVECLLAAGADPIGVGNTATRRCITRSVLICRKSLSVC